MFTREFAKDVYNCAWRAYQAHAAIKALKLLEITTIDIELQQVIDEYSAKKQIIVDCIYAFVPQELKDLLGEAKVELSHSVGKQGTTFVIYPMLTISTTPGNIFQVSYNEDRGIASIDRIAGTRDFKKMVESHLPVTKHSYKVFRFPEEVTPVPKPTQKTE